MRILFPIEAYPKAQHPIAKLLDCATTSAVLIGFSAFLCLGPVQVPW